MWLKGLSRIWLKDEWPLTVRTGDVTTGSRVRLIIACERH